MKLYTKIINDVIYTLPINKITLNKDGMQIFNPTEEMLFEEGWELYVPTFADITDEEKIKIEKEHVINDIIIYDSSDNVNIFYINNIPLWLDKITRAGLMMRLQAELSKNITETSIWYNSFEFKLLVNDAINMLYSIEIYASKCYDVTQQHIKNINNMTSEEELKFYNYQINYPEKLFFNI